MRQFIAMNSTLHNNKIIFEPALFKKLKNILLNTTFYFVFWTMNMTLVNTILFQMCQKSISLTFLNIVGSYIIIIVLSFYQIITIISRNWCDIVDGWEGFNQSYSAWSTWEWRVKKIHLMLTKYNDKWQNVLEILIRKII